MIEPEELARLEAVLDEDEFKVAITALGMAVLNLIDTSRSMGHAKPLDTYYYVHHLPPGAGDVLRTLIVEGAPAVAEKYPAIAETARRYGRLTNARAFEGIIP